MSQHFGRTVKVSTIVHLSLVAALVIFSLLARLVHRKPKERVTFVEFQVAVPPPAPEPDKPTAVPMVAPKPPEPKADIPEQPKQKPKPKPKPEPKQEPKPKPQIKRSTKRVQRTPETPKPPKTPLLSEEEIRKLLDAGARPSDRTTIPDQRSLMDGYYAHVREAMYGAWAQPAGLAAGLQAEGLIRVRKDGAVAESRLIRPSGNAVFDDSVQRALQTVRRLRPLPASHQGGDLEITIVFELENGGF